MSFLERIRDALGRSRARKDKRALNRRLIAQDEHDRKARQGEGLPPHFEEISQPQRGWVPPP
jgi:hypothetical protein